jgi:hypothetical protein
VGIEQCQPAKVEQYQQSGINFQKKIVLEACQVTDQRNAAEGLHVHNKHQNFINNLDRKRI